MTTTIGRTYRGYSDSGSTVGPVLVTVTDCYGTRRLLHAQHHADGFSWGYLGSGPADLARSILADHLGAVPPSAAYQTFARLFVANWLPGKAWVLEGVDIDAWLDYSGMRLVIAEASAAAGGVPHE